GFNFVILDTLGQAVALGVVARRIRKSSPTAHPLTLVTRAANGHNRSPCENPRTRPAMALFYKPPAKKPEAVAAPARPASPRGVSARDLAAHAANRKGTLRPAIEPPAGASAAGASVIDWSPGYASIEVLQTNPGLCAVLENAALLFAGGQVEPARALLEDGVVTDHDAKLSPLAWLALFDILQRVNDRRAFDQLAMQYI